MAVRFGLMIFLALSAVFMDFLMEKVLNGWIAAWLMIGIAFNIGTLGAPGFAWSFGGACFPLLVLFPLFYFKMLGAGDIKLLSALGGLAGVRGIVGILLYALLLGGLLSLWILISCKNFRERILYFLQYIVEFCKTGKRKPYLKHGAGAEKIHFTVPVFLGTMLYIGGSLL